VEIKNLMVLNDEEQSFVKGMHDIFENMQHAHSEFQIRNFILNDIDFPTDAGKYHQSARELYGRYNNLLQKHYEYRTTLVEIKKYELQLKYKEKEISLNTIDEFQLAMTKLDAEIDQIEIERRQAKLVQLEKEAKDVIREMRVFYDAIQTLMKRIPKEFLNKNGMPDREKSEMEFWLSKQFAAECLGQDGNRTPFNKLMGLSSTGGSIQIGMDYLGRAKLINKQLEE